MSHAYHPDLFGYDKRQILHDGCPECERRADPAIALSVLDNEKFCVAWLRAADFEHDHNEQVGPVSKAEAPLLRTLYALQVVLERATGLVIGELPR